MNPDPLNPLLLKNFSGEFERKSLTPGSTPLAKALARLQRRFGNLDAPEINHDKFDAAVRLALKDSNQLRPWQRMLLAFSLAQASKVLRGKSILQHDGLFKSLMQGWKRENRACSLRLTHWKGLFHSYMQAEAGDAQAQLCRLLKDSLERSVRTRKYVPAWLDGFGRHEHLLGKDPCAPYFDELMKGRSELLTDLQQNAGVTIPPTSWFWGALKDKAVQQINGMSEDRFRESIEWFINLDGKIKCATDDILGALLDRYDTCADRSRHPALMDFALEKWGSPRMEGNRAWGRCRKSARKMVCGWIAVQDLQEFYYLCRGDQEVDKARLEFWLRFTGQMTYTQILLGSGMRTTSDVDIRKFIRSRSDQGRLAELTGSQAWNNALMMQIGGWLFIEFSQIGTACRAIRIEDQEIETGKTGYDLSALRHTGEKWVHRPTPGWEPRFSEGLRQLGITPDVDAPAPRIARPVRGFVATPSKAAKSTTAQSVVARLKKLGLRVVDNRPKGGNLWAYPTDNTPGAILVELDRMGFRQHARKGGWFL